MTPTEQWKASGVLPAGSARRTLRAATDLASKPIPFGSDFIHVEGTCPNSRKRLTKLLADLTPSERCAICTGNGARILGLDLDALLHTRAAQQS